MQNFYYNIPTKVAFGKGQIERLPEFVQACGKKPMLVYGGGSIKRSGLYDTVAELLHSNGISFVELSGVEPNPRVTTVNKGVELCRNEGVDVLLPIGGGSTIDCAKAIAAAYYYDGDAWDVVLDDALIRDALPIVSVLTLAATGSEMDVFAVISNMQTQDKVGMGNALLFPRYSILDPTYTYSVPAYQTASGTADMMSHIFEVYFNGVPETYMQDRIMEALLKTCVKYGPIACREPENYDARANLMWTASWAINGFIGCGKGGDWPCHAMEHQLSAYYDVTHGHGLAVITPVWMEFICEKSEEATALLATYGRNVFGIAADSDAEAAKQAIAKTREVFTDMGLTLTLREMGITQKDKFAQMAQKAVGECQNYVVSLSTDDIVEIYNRAF